VLSFWFWADVASMIAALIALYFAFMLWTMMGRHGITVWLMLALLYALFLRITNISTDFSFNWYWMENSMHFTFPVYLFLALGIWGLYRQVKDRLTTKEINNSNKKRWSWLLNLRPKKRK
jgi:hypothetical protein